MWKPLSICETRASSKVRLTAPRMPDGQMNESTGGTVMEIGLTFWESRPRSLASGFFRIARRRGHGGQPFERARNAFDGIQNHLHTDQGFVFRSWRIQLG